jgi:hypothetical protein
MLKIPEFPKSPLITEKCETNIMQHSKTLIVNQEAQSKVERVNSLLSVRSENQLIEKPPLNIHKKKVEEVKSNQSFLDFDPIIDLDKSIDKIDLKKEKAFKDTLTTTTTIVNEIKENAEPVDSVPKNSLKKTESFLIDRPLIKNSETNTELLTFENGTQVGTFGTKKKKRMSLAKVYSSDLVNDQPNADTLITGTEKKKKTKKKSSKTIEDAVEPFDLNTEMQTNANNEDEEKLSKPKKVKKVKRKESRTLVDADNQDKDENSNGEKKKTKKKLKFEPTN